MLEKKIELLSPAGDLTRLKAAVDYGADAVYLAGEEFGMRTAASNFGEEDEVLVNKKARFAVKSVDKDAQEMIVELLPHEDE